jgi:hypothetical protein
MNYKSKVLVVVLVILSMLLTSCRASCGARKARKSNKYYGTTISIDTNETINLV